MIEFTSLNKHCTLATPARAEIWKCNALIINHGDGLSLIDGNFNEAELDHLTQLFDLPVKACYSTHSHIDHINNLHYLENRGVRIFSPALESGYLNDIESLLLAGGAGEQSAQNEMRDFIINELGFCNLNRADGFDPETVFAEGETRIKSIPLPGHSPGHTGYLISSPGESDILFVADIGLDDFGAWYGFSYCDLNDYRHSIARLQASYQPERQILLSSHRRPNFPGNPGDFNRILEGMAVTEGKIVQALRKQSGQTVADLTFTGLYYPLRSIKRMWGALRKLYYFWEFYTIQNHLEDLRRQQKAERDSRQRWFIVEHQLKSKPIFVTGRSLAHG